LGSERNVRRGIQQTCREGGALRVVIPIIRGTAFLALSLGAV
jgi:hypothetical protein